MRKSIVMLIAITALLFTACGGPAQTGGGVPQGYRKADVLEANIHPLIGIGAEVDPHFFSQNVTRFNSMKAEDWAIVENRVREMKIHRFRVMLLPEWLEPLNDNADSSVINWDALTPESEEMQSLYALLDLAEEEGIDVNLTLWGCNRMVKLLDQNMQNQVGNVHFLAQDNDSPNWTVGAKDAEEFAENFSMFVQLLVLQKGYTCIKDITPINEPSWTYLIDSGSSYSGNFNAYAEMCRILHNRFKADGIRDKVLFNLSDDAENMNWLTNSANHLATIDLGNSESETLADMFNSHTYQFGYTTKNTAIANWQRQCTSAVSATGKPHMIGEYGSNENVGSTRQRDIDSYERGVLIVRQALNFFNQGSSGVSHWTLYDQYYNKSGLYNEMMQLGFWRSVKSEYASETYYNELTEDYQIRPAYYAFSLLTRHTRPGAEIYPVDVGLDFVAATAFKNPDGKWVAAIANGGTEASKLTLFGSGLVGSFKHYVYENGSLPTGDAGIQSDVSIAAENGYLSAEVSANTVVLLVQE